MSGHKSSLRPRGGKPSPAQQGKYKSSGFCPRLPSQCCPDHVSLCLGQEGRSACPCSALPLLIFQCNNKSCHRLQSPLSSSSDLPWCFRTPGTSTVWDPHHSRAVPARLHSHTCTIEQFYLTQVQARCCYSAMPRVNESHPGPLSGSGKAWLMNVWRGLCAEVRPGEPLIILAALSAGRRPWAGEQESLPSAPTVAPGFPHRRRQTQAQMNLRTDTSPSHTPMPPQGKICSLEPHRMIFLQYAAPPRILSKGQQFTNDSTIPLSLA